MKNIKLLTKEELLERYIREMVRYLSFDGAKLCREDFLCILNENLPRDYTKENLIEYLNKFGSPYSFSSKYEKSNFFLSLRNYKILVKFLKILNFEMILSMIIFFYISKEKVFVYESFESLKSVLVMIFFSSLISSYTSEKIKNIKLLNSIIGDFNVEDLLYREYIKVNSKFLIWSFISWFILIYLVFRNKFYGIEHSYFQFIFLLNIFRDISKLSDNKFGKYVSLINLLSDMIIMLTLSYTFKIFGFDYLVSLLLIYFSLDFLIIIFSLIKKDKD